MGSSAGTPRISVVMPCRNAAAFLHPCIASIEAQTYPDFEVLAIDDGSTDRTRAVLADWQRRDDRVQVLTAGAGLVAALNAGVAAARGQLIARMDADDVAHADRLAAQLAAFDADPALVACGTGVRYFPRDHVRAGARRYETWLNSLHTGAAIERDIFVECPIAHPTLMVRAAALRALDGYQDRGWPEDYDLVLRLYLDGARLANVPRVLLDWRERPDRLSRNDARYSEEAFRRCKVHYLLRGRPDDRPFVVWGAGPVGKAFARELQRRGRVVRAFVDLDARKIGQTIHGAPVVAPAALPSLDGDFLVLGAVSGTGPRSEIRAALAALGKREPADYVMVA